MTLQELIIALQQKFPGLLLQASDSFFWSPAEKTVHYDNNAKTKEGLWSLLHETGHALLNHVQYYSDVELVQMEVAAWEKAREIGEDLAIEIDEDHIQDCLDSYRDWLYKRSLCPDCYLSGVQIAERIYVCIFCQRKWQVSTERFCRPYRKTI